MEELEDVRRKMLEKLMKKLKEKQEPKIIEISSIREVIEKSYEKLVLIDFYANWCMPCKYLSPILEKLANELGFILAKLNIDENPEEASRYAVQAVPTVVFLRNGREVFRFVGVREPSFIKQAVLKFL